MSTLTPPTLPQLPPDSAVVGLAVDVVALTIQQGQLCILLVQRGELPHARTWALPGGFVRQHEELAEAALRELRVETSLEVSPSLLEQFYTFTFGALERDPRGRVISVAHIAVLPDVPPPVAGGHTLHAQWYGVHQPPTLAFDHGDIVRLAVSRLQRRLSSAQLAFEFLPETFTLPELQTVYEAILNKPLDKRNFRKQMLSQGVLTPCGERRNGVGRPAQLYKSKKR